MKDRRKSLGKIERTMTRIGGILFCVLMITLPFAYQAFPNGVTGEDGAPGIFPGEHWQKATTPEQLGWSSEKLSAAREYSRKIGSAAVMIVDDGIIVDAWGDIERKYKCHSMRKSLLSALIGIHVEEGRIDLSKTMEDLRIDDNEPSLTATEKQATVGDLIKARSGIYHSALGESPAMKAKRPGRYSHEPGTFWYYNNWDFNALGTIFEQETGMGIFEEFDRRIAGPLQMEDFKIGDGTWQTRDNYGELSVHSRYCFRMSARDLARFGLLFLREGRWCDRQVILAQWVRESTASHSRIGIDRGYGYMWWNGVKGGLFPHVRVSGHSFYASGHGGHRVIVLPYRDLVVVHRVDTDRGGKDIGDREIGRLLWLILDAAGDRDIGEPTFIEAAKGVRLTGEGLKELAGGTIRGVIGSEPYVARPLPDGTISLSVGGELKDVGEWWVEGDKLCRQWRNLNGGEKACFSLVLDGTTLQFFDLEGSLIEKVSLSRD